MRRADPTSARQTQPWREAGVSRATFYRRAGETGKTEPRETIIAAEPETIIAAPAETIIEAKLSPVAPLPEVIKPVIESSYGPGRCAQCNGHVDGFEQVFVVGETRVLLHDVCLRFWVREDTRHPRVGGGWG